jgi:hypothetical protein
VREAQKGDGGRGALRGRSSRRACASGSAAVERKTGLTGGVKVLADALVRWLASGARGAESESVGGASE